MLVNGFLQIPDHTVNRLSSENCPECPTFLDKNECLHECARCGLGRTKHVSKTAREQNYSNQTEDSKKAMLKRYREFYRDYIKRTVQKNARILDVGCAEGFFAAFLQKKGFMSYGLDPYDHLQIYPGLIIHKVLFEEFEDSQPYDLITMIHSFEHFPQHGAILEKCKKLLKTNGKLLIVVPNYGGLWSRLTGKDWP